MTLQPTEAEMVAALVKLAHQKGYLVHHSRPALTGRGWRTALQGDAGLPDLLIVGGGNLWFWEVKLEKGKPTPGQVAWLEALAEVKRVDSRVIRPAGLAAAYEVLLTGTWPS